MFPLAGQVTELSTCHVSVTESPCAMFDHFQAPFANVKDKLQQANVDKNDKVFTLKKLTYMRPCCVCVCAYVH